ncbi:MAG: DUF933 domain-containing protein [Thermoanaerobaculia bacterium]|nr:DUF933 domain-containing protein [Thermoanaerobaculia bacterium]
MQVGIVGFAKAGKTTLFNLLTGSSRPTAKFGRSGEAHVGTATVPDRRLEALRDHFRPKRFTPASVTYVDVPGVARHGGNEELDLDALRQADALLHVVRAFDDPEIPHPEGSVDPARDVAGFDLELILADHDLVSRRLDRLEREAKRGLSAADARQRELLAGRVLPALDEERPVRELGLEGEEEKLVRGFQLLSAKPQLVAVNVDEGRLGGAVPGDFGLEPGPARREIVVSAPIEAEIAQLAGAEQAEFLRDLGLEEPSLDRVIRASYELLGLASFFTVGQDEVRAWTVPEGTPARRAARAIHSDLERGFIRAEVVPWDALLEHQSLAACRDRGVLRLEGRDYRTRDGDVMHIRSGV